MEIADYRTILRSGIETVCKKVMREARTFETVPTLWNYQVALMHVFKVHKELMDVVFELLDELISEGILSVRKEDDNGND